MNSFAQFVYFCIAVIAVILAIGFFIFWRRAKFWLPKYVHIFAAIGFIVSAWCMSSIPESAPINKEGVIIKVLFTLLLPAMVYFFFIFHGGQKEAFKNRVEKLKQCPYCDFPLESLQESKDHDINLSDRQCRRCGNHLYPLNPQSKIQNKRYVCL